MKRSRTDARLRESGDVLMRRHWTRTAVRVCVAWLATGVAVALLVGCSDSGPAEVTATADTTGFNVSLDGARVEASAGVASVGTEVTIPWPTIGSVGTRWTICWPVELILTDITVASLAIRRCHWHAITVHVLTTYTEAPVTAPNRPEGLNLRPEDVEQLLPSRDPPTVRFRRGSGAFQDRYYIDPILQRSLAWAAAAQEAFDQSGLWLSNPHFDSATYGFTKLNGDLVFGVSVWSYREPPPPQTLMVSGYEMPVVYLQHANVDGWHRQVGYATDHPCHGTTACIAQWTDEDLTKKRGLLSAGHLVSGHQMGDLIDLSKSLYKCDDFGTLLKVGPPRVDACILGPGPEQQHWKKGRYLHAAPIVAPGTTTVMRGQAGGMTPGIVAQVSNPGLSVEFNYQGIEFLVLLDKPGRHGDSGALVQDPISLSALGLYLGDARDITGTINLGRCQLMRQVQLAFGIELFEPC